VNGITAIVAPPAATMFKADGGASSGSEVIASHDGGLTWTVVLGPSQGWVSYLGFTTASQGVLITSDVGGDQGHSQLLMTRDGGHTWTPVRF
jgi:photosystem II stability/assembly factor-like uncharacterized protein